jgi:hypothetical protein
MYEYEPLILEADIKVEKETAYLREKASSFINLPEEKDRQVDLMYFTAIYVSSGENLNAAYFDQEELVKAEHTIVHKALDIEHNELDIVGHLYDRVYIDDQGNKLDLNELKVKEYSELKDMNIHVAIAGIIYKHRFPTIAQEVADNKWKVSMETYYKDFDIKIGDLILTRQEAESVGYTEFSNMSGKHGIVTKDGKEIASGSISKVLRSLNFSGCGLVKNPANPPSVILEVANHSSKETSDKNKPNTNYTPSNNDEVINIDLTNLDNNVTSEVIGDGKGDCKKEDKLQDYTKKSKGSSPSDVGDCVYYKHKVFSKEGDLIKENWCSKFDTTCTSFSRTAVDENCLLRQIDKEVSTYVKKNFFKKSIDKELAALERVLRKEK